jgi:cell division protein FtsB
METLHINSSTLAIVGGLLGFLLAVIAYFLDRLVKQFDALSDQFATLNKTMIKIDKDLTSDVSRLKEQNVTLKEEIKDLDPLWERMRKAEMNILAIQEGGCSRLTYCIKEN